MRKTKQSIHSLIFSQFRSSGIFCCRPDSLELAARLSLWSITQRRHFWQVL